LRRFVGAHGDAFELLGIAEGILDRVTPFVPWGAVRLDRPKTERIRHGD
jgi:hypothetical protein